jgi:membrane-associated phospholipid phosphatase
MKFVLVLMCLLTANAFAENVHIPTCDLKRNEEQFKKLSNEALVAKSNDYLHRLDNCDAVTSLYEIYQRGVAENTKKDLFQKLFLSLKKGKFLNEYTSLLMGFQKEQKHLDLERISQDHAWVYTKLIHTNGIPLSQFVHAGKYLKLLDEAEVNFKFFIQNFPNNPFSVKLKKEISWIHNENILAEINYINYYRKDGILNSDHLTVEAKKLGSILSKSSDSKYFHQGLNLLNDIMPETNFSKTEKSKIQIETKKVVSGNGKISLSKEFKEILNYKSEKDLKLSNSEMVDEFLKQKGEDRIIFLPLNREFRLKATQTLIGLGVVGIIMAFDQPIMDVVQKNKDSGSMTAIADYGGQFGELGGLAPLVLGTLAYGLVFNNDNAKNAALSSLGAVLLGQLVVETLKSATHRSRPEDGKGPFDFGGFGLGSDNTSMASGHSAAAWSVASVFAEEYGDEHKWVPYVAYTVAALTSYSRMHKNKHWASDVVVGAAIGFVAGKVFHKIFRKAFKSKVENMILTPMVGSTTGIYLTITEKAYADLKRWPLDLNYQYQKSLTVALKKDSSALDAIYSEIYLP